MRWQQYEDNLALVQVFCTMLFTEQVTPAHSLMDRRDYLGWQPPSSAHATKHYATVLVTTQNQLHISSTKLPHTLWQTVNRKGHHDSTFIGLCIVIYFCSKTNQMHQFFEFILFCSSTLHVSEGLSVHHQESKTVHTASGIRQTDSAHCLLACNYQNLFDIYLMLYVQS